MNSYSKSSNSKSSNSKSSSNNKPFCKVCYDAGKPEREYTSHYVKNKPGNEGKVVCPYLLSLVCTYCKKQEGHTAKHCPVLLAKSSSSSRSSGVAVNVSTDKADDGWTCVGERKSHNNKSAPAKQQQAPAQQAPVKQQQASAKHQQEAPIFRRNMAESPVTPPPTSGKKIIQWSTVVKSAPTKPCEKPAPVAPVIIATPSPTEKDRASFRVIPEDDCLSEVEEECAAVSGSSGYCYGAYSNSSVSSGNWGDDVDDY